MDPSAPPQRRQPSQQRSGVASPMPPLLSQPQPYAGGRQQQSLHQQQQQYYQQQYLLQQQQLGSIPLSAPLGLARTSSSKRGPLNFSSPSASPVGSAAAVGGGGAGSAFHGSAANSSVNARHQGYGYTQHQQHGGGGGYQQQQHFMPPAFGSASAAVGHSMAAAHPQLFSPTGAPLPIAPSSSSAMLRGGLSNVKSGGQQQLMRPNLTSVAPLSSMAMAMPTAPASAAGSSSAGGVPMPHGAARGGPSTTPAAPSRHPNAIPMANAKPSPGAANAATNASGGFGISSLYAGADELDIESEDGRRRSSSMRRSQSLQQQQQQQAAPRSNNNNSINNSANRRTSPATSRINATNVAPIAAVGNGIAAKKEQHDRSASSPLIVGLQSNHRGPLPQSQSQPHTIRGGGGRPPGAAPPGGPSSLLPAQLGAMGPSGSDGAALGLRNGTFAQNRGGGGLVSLVAPPVRSVSSLGAVGGTTSRASQWKGLWNAVS